ncbi:hypothetical protein AB0E69_39445 [Kribbella sp. NPDC026611]|uniref:hypothetical protein n=1 Tax=Kribbella sp. NPDC026611 TaxID=3154911 RepID=UPI0033D90C81
MEPDGVDADDPASKRHRPTTLSGFTFHEGRHTHATWLTEDGIVEVARRARLGHEMKGMGRMYDHVTPEMERQILEALDERFLSSVLALDDGEREKLLAWVPVIKDTVEKAPQEAEKLADKVVGAERFSPKSLPQTPQTKTGQGRKCLLTCGYCWWSLGDSNP